SPAEDAAPGPRRTSAPAVRPAASARPRLRDAPTAARRVLRDAADAARPLRSARAAPAAGAAASSGMAPMTPLLSYGGGPPIARDPARELARRELQKPVYHQDDPSFVERIFNKISDWLNQLSHSLTGVGGGGGGGWLGFVVLFILLVVVVAAVWWRIGSVRRNAAGPKPLLGPGTATAEDHRAAA